MAILMRPLTFVLFLVLKYCTGDNATTPSHTCRIPTVALSNGVEMPQLMLGTAHLRDPDHLVPSNPKFNGLVPEEVYKSLHAALTAGWRGIDSAFIYRSHRAIGFVLAHWFMEGKLQREDVFLTTKIFHGPIGEVSIVPKGTYMENMEMLTPDEAAQATEDHLQESIVQVGVGYFDLVLMHWPAQMDSQDEGNRARRIAAWRVLEKYYEIGWVRAIGVSNFSEDHLQQLVDDGAKVTPMVNQIEASVYMQHAKILDYCKAHRIILQAYSPLGRGVTNALKDEVVLAIAEKHKRDAGQIAMRYLIQKGYAITSLSSSSERLETNQDIFYFELDADDMTKLDVLNRPDGSWGLPSPYGMT